MTNRKTAGEQIDSKNIRKHKNDIFRLSELIVPADRIKTPKGVYEDIQLFIKRMKDEPVDLKQLGIIGRTKEQIIDEIAQLYIIDCTFIK